jgi:epoxyqueuosine reductase
MRHYEGMNPAQRTRWITEQARALGFNLSGVARPDALGELERLPEWLEKGYAGEMKYLHDSRRSRPSQILPGARSLIVVALNYNSSRPYSTEQSKAPNSDSPRGWISRYAWGDDYHQVLGEKLEELLAAMHREFGEAPGEPFEARAYVDTGPVVERVAAKYAGLGWLAKNTCLINDQEGSWLFLGVIVTTLELEPSLASGAPPPRDLCGNCTMCLDACPTEAFPEPYVLDARRCISYLTIELRGTVPESLRPAMGNAVFGCDICQDVCPWNRKAPATRLAAFEPRTVETNYAHEPDEADKSESLFSPKLEWLASLAPEEFSRVFRGSAVKRAKWRGLVRNACVALGNSRLAPHSKARARVVELLEKLAASEDSLISEHARWALSRLGPANPPIDSQLFDPLG